MIKKMLLSGAVFAALFSGTVVFAENQETKNINERIKSLRDRLETFRTKINPDRALPSQKTQEPSNQLPDNIEERKDAKVIVLFHDNGEKAPATQGKDSQAKGNRFSQTIQGNGDQSPKAVNVAWGFQRK